MSKSHKSSNSNKKVLLIVIDALASEFVYPAMRDGRLPNLQRLHNVSSYRGDSIAVFPSITPAATSSIITGVYPVEHEVFGAYWYKPETKTIVYYGYDVWAILEEGIGRFIDDYLIRLNRDFLHARTFFEQVEDHGRRAANLNFIVFSGKHPHEMKLPFPANLLPNVPGTEEMKGPETLFFGDFIRSPMPNGKKHPNTAGGMFHRFGYNDERAAELAIALAEASELPDFSVAYFPNNDFESHNVGPEAALEKLAETDALLGQIFDAHGGLEQMLSRLAIVLTGDHSQSNVIDDAAAGIDLNEILEGFSVADSGMPMDKEDDLVVCPNLRTAQLYFHTPHEQRLELVVRELLNDLRIDQVIWQANLTDTSEMGTSETGTWVATQDRGRLCFRPGGDSPNRGPNCGEDAYGGAWSWEGDLRCVDAEIQGGKIVFGDYPNAFERIQCGIANHDAGHVWVTARPGYEFQIDNEPIHPGGGSHGSLHRLDSISPLLIAGASEQFPTHLPARSVDIVPICASILGLEGVRPPGQSHARA